MTTAAAAPRSHPEGGALEVPINGTVYLIPVPTGENGSRLAALMREADRLVLGEAFEYLCVEKVSWVKIQRLSRYALVYFLIGPEAAELLRVTGAFTGDTDFARDLARHIEGR